MGEMGERGEENPWGEENPYLYEEEVADDKLRD